MGQVRGLAAHRNGVRTSSLPGLDLESVPFESGGMSSVALILSGPGSSVGLVPKHVLDVLEHGVKTGLSSCRWIIGPHVSRNHEADDGLL